MVDAAILLVHLRLQLKENGENLQAEVDKITLVCYRALEEIQHFSLEGSLMPTICLDVVESKHAYGLEEELGAAEVILDCALEHLLLDHYLVVEVVGV